MPATTQEQELLSIFHGKKTVMCGGYTNMGMLGSCPLGQYFCIQFDDLSFIAFPGSPEVAFQKVLPRDVTLNPKSMFTGLVCESIEQDGSVLKINFQCGSGLSVPYKPDSDLVYLGAFPEVVN